MMRRMSFLPSVTLNSAFSILNSQFPMKLSFEQLLALRLSEDDVRSVVRRPVVGVLEDIRSLYNVGSCFRTADGLLLERLVLTGYTPAPPRKEISKTALGAEQVVPWEHHADRREGIERLRGEGYEVWGVELTDDAIPLDRVAEIGIPDRLALVFGNELSGIRAETLELCDRTVAIPMAGVKHSYNVAVSFGMVMWEVTRSRTA